MNEQKHTPGPWEAEPEMAGDGTPIHGSWQVHGTGEFPEPVCVYATEVDARLIAAAPDLREALERIAAEALECGETTANPHWKVVEDLARAALAKAKGGAA